MTLIRVIVAVVLVLLFGGEKKALLMISLEILFVVTVLYEFAKEKKVTWLIFLLVGVGYVLRFFVGFFLLVPFKRVFVNRQMIYLAGFLWAYGSFAAIASWVKEVTLRMQKSKETVSAFPLQYEKKHFQYIQNIIAERYTMGEQHSINGKIMLMREKGELRDPWNTSFFCGLIFLFFAIYCEQQSGWILITEAAIGIIFIMSIYFCDKKKLALIGIMSVMCIGEILVAGWSYSIDKWYLLLALLQLMMLVTYIILCYQPQLRKEGFIKRHQKLTGRLRTGILGEYAANIMDKEKSQYNRENDE